jgi:hypothetical protein
MVARKQLSLRIIEVGSGLGRLGFAEKKPAFGRSFRTRAG